MIDIVMYFLALFVLGDLAFWVLGHYSKKSPAMSKWTWFVPGTGYYRYFKSK